MITASDKKESYIYRHKYRAISCHYNKLTIAKELTRVSVYM